MGKELTPAQKEEMAAEYTAKAATMRAVKGSDTRMCEMLEGEREAEEAEKKKMKEKMKKASAMKMEMCPKAGEFGTVKAGEQPTSCEGGKSVECMSGACDDGKCTAPEPMCMDDDDDDDDDDEDAMDNAILQLLASAQQKNRQRNRSSS